MKTRFIRLAAVLSGALAAAPAFAHHSFNMFDMRPEAEIVLEGVVKEWALVNPHSWLTITVTNADGSQTDWSLEGAAVAQLVPKGITIETYKVGTKVRVVAGPLKDGRHGGVLKFVQHADGTFTLPNDVGNIGQEALDRWKAKNPKGPELGLK
ncbi:MAG: hypothetical protein C5B57_05930 [Blastocatellia bacterium]|nr:MAG: hypothetical protein C5B57_05930 [Blastocatellia bacterium]